MPHRHRDSRGEISSTQSLRWQTDSPQTFSPGYSNAPSMPESRQHRPSILDEQFIRGPDLDESYGTPSHWIDAIKQHQADLSEQQTLAQHKRARLHAKARHLTIGKSTKPLSASTVRLQDSDGPAFSVNTQDYSNPSTTRSSTRPTTTRSTTRPSTVHSRFSARSYISHHDEKIQMDDPSTQSHDPDQSTFLTATDDVERMSDDEIPAYSNNEPCEPVTDEATSSVIASLNTYESFVHSRVRHMLVKNYVFIAKNGDAFVSTKRDRAEASHSSVAPFHLPSLQCDSHMNYKSSSASVELASPDEQQLYSLILFLSRIPLFAELPLSAFITMAQHLHLQVFDEFEVIAAENEPGEFVYFIHKGRVDVKLNINHAATDPTTQTNMHEQTEPERDLYVLAQSAEFVSTPAPTQKRRFHSINSASLDIACLGTGDLAGDSALLTGRNASSVIAVTAGCECYAIHYQNLFCVLRDYPTLQSFLSYVTYSSLLRQRHAVVRDRYRSSYTSAVKFSLFVDGSLRRNLSHRNQRRKLIREAIGGGGNHSNVTSLIDQHAHAQIRHTQKFERRTKRMKIEAEKRRYGLVANLSSSEDEAELIELTTVPVADRIRRRSLIDQLPFLPIVATDDTNADKLPRIEQKLM